MLSDFLFILLSLFFTIKSPSGDLGVKTQHSSGNEGKQSRHEY